MQHLDEGTVHAWLDSALSGDEAARVEQHAAECTECAAMVAEARGLIAGAARVVGALDVVPGGVIPMQPARKSGAGSLWRSLRFTPMRAALAASLIVAIGTLSVVRHERDRSPAKQTAAMAIGPQVTTPAADSTRVQATAPVASAAPTAPPPARVMAATVAPPKGTSSSRAEKRVAAAEPAADATAGAASAAKNTVVVDSSNKVGATASSPAMVPAATSPPAMAPAVASMRDAVVAQRQSAAGMARQLSAVPNADVSEFIGCYRLGEDTSAALRALPGRFALARSATPPSRSLVFPVDASGKPDSTIVGTWRPITPTTVVMTLERSAAQPSVIMTFAATGYSARPFSSPSGRSVPVFRSDCRP